MNVKRALKNIENMEKMENVKRAFRASSFDHHSGTPAQTVSDLIMVFAIFLLSGFRAWYHSRQISSHDDKILACGSGPLFQNPDGYIVPSRLARVLY
jgi:hypothetical protein